MSEARLQRTVSPIDGSVYVERGLAQPKQTDAALAKAVKAQQVWRQVPIAERVETAEVLLCLASIGIDYAQGHYVAYPESVESLSRITRSTPRMQLKQA